MVIEEFGKAAEAIGKASEALASVIREVSGIVIDPAKKKADAKAEMEIEKKRLRHQYELKRIDLIERVKQRFWEKEVGRFCNIESIGIEAFGLLPENADPYGLDRDWLNHFITSCQDVGEDEIRGLWARILSQEATTPGMYTKRTLDYLKNFSVADCRLFEVFKSFIFRHKSYSVFIVPGAIRSGGCLIWQEFSERFAFPFEQFIHLVNIGIVSPVQQIFLPLPTATSLSLAYFGRSIAISNEPGTEYMLDEGIYLLSEVGHQLANVVEGKLNNSYFGDVIEALRRVPLSVEVVDGISQQA